MIYIFHLILSINIYNYDKKIVNITLVINTISIKITRRSSWFHSRVLQIYLFA